MSACEIPYNTICDFRDGTYIFETHIGVCGDRCHAHNIIEVGQNKYGYQSTSPIDCYSRVFLWFWVSKNPNGSCSRLRRSQFGVKYILAGEAPTRRSRACTIGVIRISGCFHCRSVTLSLSFCENAYAKNIWSNTPSKLR